ncbi:hypothetical protein GYMLUDRAFT_180036 [Collybiopsis luxurians FD-317 M1]|uniref:Cytochrome P450 n=1 Tax=Collybiopsis luxurians FD-317 M1 TaxID=944289 RepID=A0A0D0BSF5_9AGAR|nr:hypothetical protein GYMLUDRAFT_180036 [Collybiopsis luxurians FD-317 M1]
MLFLTTSLYVIWNIAIRFKDSKLPPGPRKWPFIGNLLHFPRANMWLRFHEWHQQYGDTVYAEALGRGVLVLGSMEVITELLTDNASTFSDRPTFTMIGEMIGLKHSLPMLPYGPKLKQHRKLCHFALSQDSVKKYCSTQEDAVAMYLSSILNSPSTFYEELRLAAGRIIMSVTYGIAIQRAEDIYITEAEQTMDMISKSTVPGAHLVDLLPPLRYIPSWFPFNTIHSFALQGRVLLNSMVRRPYEHVKREVAAGAARSSFVSDCFESFESDSGGLSSAEQEHLILWASGAMYGGKVRAPQTFASILSFILAMARFPNVQKKIQQEVDAITGGGRLPTLRDRPNMPYTEASLKEVLRWRPALPLSLARKTRHSVEYKGYIIPKDTIVLPNVWAVSVDEKSGIPSSRFAPERHMKEHVKETAIDPASYAFGFGRRVCPGRFLGENNLFLLVSGLMAIFNVKESPGDNNTPLNPEYKSGLVS